MTKRGLMALALVACLILSGCSPAANTTITPIETTPAPITEQTYAGAEYYAPDAPTVYEDDIIPGAPSLTAGSQDNSPAAQADAQPGSNQGSMLRGDLTYAVVVGDDAEINPFHTNYRDFYAVNQLVFESVVELNESLQPTPMLADRWTNEGDEWVFTLRAGIKFHNGQEMTAYDVVASYEEILKYPATVWYDLVQNIERMQAIDNQTLRVKSKGVGYMILYSMTFPVAHRSTVSIEQPMGTGPYWYMRYDKGISLRLESNPLWWRRASGTINSVVVLCYKSIQSALIGIELGEFDALATDYPTASLSRGLTDRLTRDYSTQTYELIVPNLKSDILEDISVRQALMYAIDRATLGDTIYAGMVQESEVPVVPGSWLYDPHATRFNYSPERALQILYDADWADIDSDGVLEKSINGQMVRLSLRLETYDRGTTATRSEAIETIARQLKLVGFEIITETKKAEDVLSDMDKGKFDLALVGFELSLVPNLAFLFTASVKGNCDYSRYASAAMDGWLHDAYKAMTENDLKAAMSKVQMQVVDDLPILGLFFRAGVMISRTSISGLKGNQQYDVLRDLARVTQTAK